MSKRTIQNLKNNIIRCMRPQIWKKIVMTLSCIVVFVTTYMMILPAITLERDTAKAEDGAAGPVIEADSAQLTPEPPALMSGVQTVTGPDFIVTVDVPELAKIPSDATLAVDEMTDETYELYYAQALTDLGAVDMPFARFFDIRFELDGQEIQPATDLNVTIELAEALKDDALAVHFEHKEDVTVAEPDASIDDEEPKALSDASMANEGPEALSDTSIAETESETLTDNPETLTDNSGTLTDTPETLTDNSGTLTDTPEPLTDTPQAAGAEPNKTEVLASEMVVAEHLNSAVSFTANSFSVYGIIGTIESTVLASDGHNYRITVTCEADSGIPGNAALEVSEITESSLMHGMSYEEYVAHTEDALGMREGSAGYIRLFDITIVDRDDPDVKYQPAQDSTVDVRIELADSTSDNMHVVHFSDDGNTTDVVENITENGDAGSVVEFSADSFSVYVIVNHEEDEDIVTPRVEFHFIDPDYTESGDPDTGAVVYMADAYEFVNKHGEYQTTQILQDGEGLEKINNPANIITHNPDETTTEKYFYGWYIVDGSGTESIVYRWTEDPANVPFESAITVNYDGSTDPGTVTWSLNGTEYDYEADDLGCAHVYLAPLYEDYYFVNFHLNSVDSEGELKNSLLTRKLIAFGNDGEAEVRIGDVICPSPDARHLVFIGWQEEDAGTDYYATVNEAGEEVNSEGSSDGYYITIHKSSDENDNTYDLYPVYTEARWIYYNTGRSGNGSSYVGAQYRLTNDEGRGNSLTSLPVPVRDGYVFRGWYTEQDSEFNGTGTQLTDGNGAFVEGIRGQTIYSGSEKAYEVTGDGNLYFYKGLSQDGLTVYARWEPETVDYTVVYWLQNADDDGYTLMHYETKQGISGAQTAAAEIPADHALYTEKKLRFCHLSEDQDPDRGGDQTGIQQKVIEGDGSTIVNVYYDRNVYTLRFDIGFAQRESTGGSSTTYSQMTAEEAAEYSGTVYGYIDGSLVELTPDGNGGYTYPGTVTTRHDYGGYRYQETTGNETPQYGVVDGSVVELEGSTTTEYYLSSSNNAGAAEYTGTIYNANSNIVPNPVYPTTYYSRTRQRGRLYWLNRTVSSYTYNNGTAYGNGTRYLQVENSDSDSTYRLGFVDGSMQSISHDAQGWYYNTESPSTIAYTGTLYKQVTESGTWTYYVSPITSTDNYYDFLTNTRASLGTTMPQEFITCETYTETVNGTPCKVYYYDLTAKYGENILDRYPGSQSRKGGYSFVGWVAQQDSYFWATQKTSIKGFFETMSEALILTGTPYTDHDAGKQDISQDSCIAVTSENGAITQEFRCRYTDRSNNYLYRIYLADPETLEYTAEPSYKYVITAGTGSHPNMQTPPTYQGYHLVDTRELSSVNDTVGSTPSGSYSNPYAIPELTAAGLASGRIISFKFQPNDHKISFMYGSGANSPNTLVDPDNEFYTYYYGQSLSTADIYTQTAIANTPPGHTFSGWYENLDGIGNTFNFDTTMPDGDIVLYAVYKPLRYRVKINPNGAEIDHIDHTGAAYTGTYQGTPYSVQPFNRAAIDGERQADSGYNSGYSTYINADFGEAVSEYTLSRNYVPISDAVAETYDGKIYYYINTQYQSTDGSGLPSALRNALYVTEDELDDYYQFYYDWMQTNLTLNPGSFQGTQLLSYAAWKQLYVSEQKYRICNSRENYIFLGWFKDNENMPYNFEDPVEEPFTLTAKWRLDGGYTIEYHADYTTGDGTKISGTLPSWTDPEPGATTLNYADGADTSVSKQPDSITADGELVEDDSYIFRGWQLVALKTDGTGNTSYVPLEEGVYYDPDDAFVVRAELADAESVIHMQAVYEKKTGSYRRPEIANLTLDANTGYVSLDGSSELGTNTDLTDTWTGIVGTVAATVTTDEGDTEIIEFGDIQSNEEVHLYRYATEAGMIAPDGKNYFVHPDGYLLLGFDDNSNEGDYIATYPSDAVISVQRTDEETIYAVWEPMVYITFENETGVGDVTFALSSTDSSALSVVNTVDGTYTRTELRDLGNITVREGKSITLAIPQGAEKSITINGTNTLGTGNVLTWDSSVTLDDVLYENTTYSHTVGEDTHSHTLPSGQVVNGKAFSFDETLITDRTGLIVTFKSKPNDYTIVLDDNYVGGGTQEYNYEAEEVLTGDDNPKTALLPNTSTRIGYELIGWAFDPEAVTPDYSASNGWTIDNLENFFQNAETTETGTKVETLYAVWRASAEAHVVKAYKEVPLPGSRSQDFTFTVNLTGTFTRNGTAYDVASGSESSGTFAIKHGGYLLITDSNSIGSSSSRAYVQAVVRVFDGDDVEDVSQRRTVRWQHSANGSGSFNKTEKVHVTEVPADYYTTEVTRAAQTELHPLTLGSDSNTTDIPYTIAGNTVSFDTDAGGTVIFTNTQETKDIAVEKELVSNTSATAQFSFTASYELDGATVDLGTFYVSGGSVNAEALRAIPAGAVLTITEAADNDYETTVTVGSGTTGSGAAGSGAAGSGAAQAGKTTSFTVTDDATVLFKNTLKSYPVRFVKVDQEGTAGAVEAFFTLASETGTLGTNLYPNAQNNGLIYNSSALYVGTYTLTETWTEDGYLGLSRPVTVNVTGDGVSCADDNVKVTGSAENGYVVTVYNVETKEITITKTLVDPLITQRQFDFTFTYTYTPPWLTSEDTVTGTEQFTFVPTITTAATKKIRVPVGANVTVSEDVSELAALYETTVALGSGNPETAATYTIEGVDEDAAVAFVNTRKTVDITVQKVLTDPTAGGTFPFTAVLRNGSEPVTVYTVYPGSGGTGSLVTDATGSVGFTLAHNGTQVLTVPVGAKLIISETAAGYSTTTAAANGTADEDTAEKSFTMTVAEEDTITFTNSTAGSPVVLRKVGVSNTDETHAQRALGGAEFSVYTAKGAQLDEKDQLVVVDGRSLTGLVSDELTGVFWSGQLPAGTYIIEEDAAPAGYNSLGVLIRMEITGAGVVLTHIGTAGDVSGLYNVPEMQGGSWVVTLINTTGVVLPHTGGPGLGLIYGLGGLLVVMAAAGLGMRRWRLR